MENSCIMQATPLSAELLTLNNSEKLTESKKVNIISWKEHRIVLFKLCLSIHFNC